MDREKNTYLKKKNLEEINIQNFRLFNRFWFINTMILKFCVTHLHFDFEFVRFDQTKKLIDFSSRSISLQILVMTPFFDQFLLYHNK